MAIAGMLGGAMGGSVGGAGRAVGMGGGNGGSFAQKQPMMGGMMKQNMMRPQGKMMPQMGGQMGNASPAFGNRMAQQFQQIRQQPGLGIGPRMGGIPPFMPGGNTGIAGGIFNRPGGFGTPPYFPQQGGGVMQPQVQGPNGESPNQQQGGGFQDMMRKLMEQFGQQRQGGEVAQTQGGPQRDFQPGGRFNMGIGPRMQRQIAPMMDMMGGGQQRIVRNPVMEEEMQGY